MRDYRRILALVDFSPSGLAAARRALSLARLGRAELALLHVSAPDADLDGGYPPPSRSQARQVYEEAGLRRLTFHAAEMGAGEAVLLARHGFLAAEFSRVVHDWQPDLVVAGEGSRSLAGRHDLLVLGCGESGGRLRRLLRPWLASLGLAAGV